MHKEHFLRQEFPAALRTINPNNAPLFGKMNPQQMVEHMAEYIRLAYGNPVINQVFYTMESLEKMRHFLHSDKPFRENTPNPLLTEVPRAVVFPTYEAAIQDLEIAMSEFFNAFAENKELEVLNPFFGLLNVTWSMQLLVKHAQHHLRQFGILS